MLIKRSGFNDWQQVVIARSGFPQLFQVRLVPTAERVQEQRRKAAAKRSWSYVIGGTGLALLSTSAALYIDNNSRYRHWSDGRDSLAREAEQGSPTLSEHIAASRQTAVSIQRQDDVALGTALLGGAVVGYAIASWFTAD